MGFLLLGFGWFANFKVYERDKTQMKAELESAITHRLSESSIALAKTVGKAAAEVAKPLQEAIRSIQGDLELMALLHAEADVDKWVAAGVWDNAIRSALKLISLSNKRDEHWRVVRALETVTLAVNTGAGASWTVFDDIAGVLQTLPARHKGDVDNITRILTDRRAQQGKKA
ncbi:MAG: hypothetical protein ABIU97_02290 [Dehalococcoidia bacterium]